MKLLPVAVFVCLFIALSNGSNILGFFPTPSISHQVVFHGLFKELASRGHSLTIITTDVIKPLVNNPNVTQIDLHSSYKDFQEKINFVEYKDKKMDEIELMDFFFPIMMDILEEQLNHPEVRKLINEKKKYKFDVVIFEYLMYYPLVAFGEIFDCPVIGITSLDAPRRNHEIIGNEANPVIHPELMFPYINKRLNFFEKWKILRYYLNEKLYQEQKWEKRQMKIIEKYFPNNTLKSGFELMSRVDFLMVNAHPALGFIRPIIPKTIQLGFMHIESPKELPNGDLKKFVDDAENGVIYMSFGSNVKSKDLEPRIQNIFLNVFKSLKYKFIWKFEAENIPNKPSNVMISKWLPQADLLAHPNVKLFITQGGQQSMEEAIDRAVPMIVIPFLGDQGVNAIRMEQRKIGYPLELHEMSEDKLRKAIEEMLKPEYKKNIQKLRELIHDQPMTSREKAAWWTEYVIRHKGTKHLEYTMKDIPFYEKYFMDFIAIGIIILLMSFKIFLFILKFTFVKNSDQKIKSQ
jgi:glucuronosyltransferase